MQIASPRPPIPPVTNAIRLLLFICRLLTLDCQRNSHTVLSIRPLLTLNRQRYAHTAAHTQTRQPLVRVTTDHLVQQRNQNAAPGGADRMTDGDRPTVDVDSRRI